jgi:hypothetical protein
MKTKIISVALFLSIILGAKAFAGDPVKVPEKVTTAFQNSFPEIQNEKWNEGNGFYEVSFFESKKSWCRIFYSSDGVVLETFRYYKEEGLPLFIRTKLGKDYAGKDVLGVTEVHFQDQTKYYIMLQDEHHIYQVISNQFGSLQLDKKLNRAN